VQLQKTLPIKDLRVSGNKALVHTSIHPFELMSIQENDVSGKTLIAGLKKAGPGFDFLLFPGNMWNKSKSRLVSGPSLPHPEVEPAGPSS
jgi:hypothetical protein